MFFQRGLAAGITIFAPAIILSTILGWNLILTNIVIGSLVTIYTLLLRYRIREPNPETADGCYFYWDVSGVFSHCLSTTIVVAKAVSSEDVELMAAEKNHRD